MDFVTGVAFGRNLKIKSINKDGVFRFMTALKRISFDMKCTNCSIDLKTKYLGICEKCRTISWSPKYINRNLQ